MGLKRSLSVLLTIILACFALNCNDAPQNSSDIDMGIDETPTMHLRLTAGYDDVGGFYFEVFSGAELVDYQYVALEDENFANHLSPGTGDAHRFSDAYFVLEPGIYEVVVYPMVDEHNYSDDCQPATTVVEVLENETTEVVLFSQCDGTDAGGLDVIVITNHDPNILDLVYNNSKFILTCEELAITVTAEDPDNDPLVYEWQVVTAPSDYYFASYDANVFWFGSAAAGDYEVMVTVCDTVLEPLCTTLTFPIHVQMGGYDYDGDGIDDSCYLP